MRTKDDKKVALKLINHYADQYKRVEEEKQSLQLEVNDMKMNLKINKEIIDSFFKMEKKDKAAIYISKSKEEIELLNRRNECLSSEIARLRLKIVNYEQIVNQSIMQYRESTESLTIKIFVLENVVQQKENMITLLNNKLRRYKERDLLYCENPIEEREIVIIEPVASVKLIHEDLMLYKQAYESALQKLKESKNTIEQYSNQIDELKNEIENLYEKDKSAMDREKSKSIRDDTSNPYTKNNQFQCKMNLHTESTKPQSTIGVNQKNWQTDEWYDILKSVCLSPDELEKLSKNKMLTKIIEAIEILNKVIMERNMQIRLIAKENENLNQKNSVLNNDNISLMKCVFLLKNEIRTLKNKFQDSGFHFMKKRKTTIDIKEDPNDNPGYLNTNMSMIGNTSREEKKKMKKINDRIIKSYNDCQSQSIRLNQSFNEEKINSMTEGDEFDFHKNITEGNDMIEIKMNEEVLDRLRNENAKASTALKNIENESKTKASDILCKSGQNINDNQSENDSVIYTKNKSNKYQRDKHKGGVISTMDSFTTENLQKMAGFISNNTDFEKLSIHIPKEKGK